MGFLPPGNSTRSQASFLCKDAISSTMGYFHSFPSFESTASLMVLGSSSVIVKEKFEQKEDGIYLFGCLLSRADLLTAGVCGSSSSEPSSVVGFDSSSFSSNYIFSGSFGRNSCLITSFTSLNTTSWLYTDLPCFWVPKLVTL